MSEPVIVRIPTKALKNILGDQPDALVQVERMACEKIAEEMKRKLVIAGDTKVQEQAEKIVRQALYRVSTDKVRDMVREVLGEVLESKWFKDRVRKLLTGEITSANKELVRNLIREALK